MDPPQSTPFPGKLQPPNSKANRTTIKEHKTSLKEAPNHRQKRFFGTNRSTNVLVKAVAKKSLTKPSVRITTQPQKPKASHKIPTKPNNKQPLQITELKGVIEAVTASSTNAIVSNPEIKVMDRKSSSNVKNKMNKNVCFQEPIDSNLTKTPVSSSSSVGKPRIPGTPYYSAENCSNCRLDRLETARYWLDQIKLAESVEKHFISTAFFRLAFESKAQPFRTLGLELKRYLARHECLSAENEWRDVLRSYEELKDGRSEAIVDLVDQEQKYLKKQPDTPESQTKCFESKDGLEFPDKVENRSTEALDQTKKDSCVFINSVRDPIKNSLSLNPL